MNVVLNVLYTVGIHSFRIYKIHAFSGKFLLSDVHRRQYVQLCCSDTHRNSLPKNKSRILKIGWLTKKKQYLKVITRHTNGKWDSEKNEFTRNTTVAIKDVIPHPMRTGLGLPGGNCCKSKGQPRQDVRMRLQQRRTILNHSSLFHNVPVTPPKVLRKSSKAILTGASVS